MVEIGVYARVGDRNTAVWASVDGITWSRVIPHGEADFGVVIVNGETGSAMMARRRSRPPSTTVF